MSEFAAAALPLARGVLVAAFVLLAVVAVVRARLGGPAGARAAVMFSALAFALVEGWVRDAFGIDLPVWADVLRLVLIVMFPLLLLRFTATFHDFPGWLTGAAGGGAAGAVAVAIGLAVAGTDGSGRSALTTAAVLAVVAYWASVSLVSVVSLWRAGRGQPTVARRRMRLMSGGAALLIAALVLAGVVGNDVPEISLAVQCLAIASAGVFGLGFYPPTPIRLAWRRPEEEQVHAATMAVLRAVTPEEVARQLLPPTVRLVGGAGATLVDAHGRVVTSYGDAPADSAVSETEGVADRRRPTPVSVPVGEEPGRLIVWTSPYAPFFARQEIELLHTLGAVAGLALERCKLLDDERVQRAAVEQAHEDATHAREAADRANLAKSEFLARMSHELRTPLNAILGFGQLLELSSLDPDDREGVDHILKAGRHLLALINDVLDLSSVEAGRLTISPEPVEAGELIGDVVKLMQPLADQRSIRLTVDIHSPGVYVMTDRQRCRQVLLNLLSNAVKYNHDGGQVAVSTHATREGTLRINVRDTGPGIHPKRHEELFAPFERLGAEGSGVEGTGLGLSLSKQLMQRLSGAIGVDSVPGEGSTFWVDLPMTEAPSHEKEPARRPSVRATGEHTLLLAEDNLANLRVVEAMLRSRPNISVLPAMQGRLAIELATQHQPDVIVLDLHLPDLPGREVLHRLRADPRTRHIPVVIASAEATPGTTRRLLEEGAFAYVTKPLDLEAFLQAVDDAIAHGRSLARPSTSAPDNDQNDESGPAGE